MRFKKKKYFVNKIKLPGYLCHLTYIEKIIVNQLLSATIYFNIYRRQPGSQRLILATSVLLYTMNCLRREIFTTTKFSRTPRCFLVREYKLVYNIHKRFTNICNEALINLEDNRTHTIEDRMCFSDKFSGVVLPWFDFCKKTKTANRVYVDLCRHIIPSISI